MVTIRESRGFTLVEILAASLIASVVAGGTLMAFVTAARISRLGNSAQRTEAALFATQTLERFRNRISATSGDAAKDTWLDDQSNLGKSGWTTDDLPSSAGSQSIIALGAKRCYRLTKEDCDQDRTTGDCYALQTQVCWSDTSRAGGCQCP